MKDDVTFPTEEKKEEALEAFDNSHPINKTYGAGLVPVGAQPTLKYVASAWRNYTDEHNNVINYDLDPYALFVYQGNTFKDPGYTIYDEEGEVIQDKATVNIVLKRQLSPGASKYDTDSGVTDYPLTPNDSGEYSLNGVMIRMDVYKMSYSYTLHRSDGSTTELTAERPLIVLSKRGDIFLTTTPTVNDGDVDYLANNTQNINSGNSLVAYRCMDFIITETSTINDGDVDYLRKNTQMINASNEQYYTTLSQ